MASTGRLPGRKATKNAAAAHQANDGGESAGL